MKKLLAIVIAVTLWLSIPDYAVAQEPYVGTLEFLWDTPAAVKPVGEVANQCVVEIRQDGKVVPGAWATFTVPGCVPLTEEPLAGQCGSSVTFTLNPPYGNSRVWARCIWVADDQILSYLALDPETEMDAEHFWLFDTVERPAMFLPLIFRNASP